MKKSNMTLFAIYKNGKHLGNEKGKSEVDAIKSYLIAADLEKSIYNITNQYSATLAINGVHHYFIKH